MKYILVLIVVVLAVMWLTRSRAPAVRREKPPPAGPQAMVACAHCGVHLPRAEAVAGAQGLYCSEAHRLARSDAA